MQIESKKVHFKKVFEFEIKRQLNEFDKTTEFEWMKNMNSFWMVLFSQKGINPEPIMVFVSNLLLNIN